MQRMNPEDAAKLQGLDLETEKASARLNMIMNVAAFVVIVGVLRVGECGWLAFMMYSSRIHDGMVVFEWPSFLIKQ